MFNWNEKYDKILADYIMTSWYKAENFMVVAGGEDCEERGEISTTGSNVTVAFVCINLLWLMLFYM